MTTRRQLYRYASAVGALPIVSAVFILRQGEVMRSAGLLSADPSFVSFTRAQFGDGFIVTLCHFVVLGTAILTIELHTGYYLRIRHGSLFRMWMRLSLRSFLVAAGVIGLLVLTLSVAWGVRWWSTMDDRWTSWLPLLAGAVSWSVISVAEAAVIVALGLSPVLTRTLPSIAAAILVVSVLASGEIAFWLHLPYVGRPFFIMTDPAPWTVVGPTVAFALAGIILTAVAVALSDDVARRHLRMSGRSPLYEEVA